MARKAEKIAYKGTVKGIKTAKSLLSGGATIAKGVGTLLNIGSVSYTHLTLPTKA